MAELAGIVLLYNTLLGRQPTTAEISYWTTGWGLFPPSISAIEDNLRSSAEYIARTTASSSGTVTVVQAGLHTIVPEGYVPPIPTSKPLPTGQAPVPGAPETIGEGDTGLLGAFNELARETVNGIAGGITWIKDRLAEVRVWLTQAMVNAMADPWGALATIVGATLVTVGLQALYNTLKSQAWFVALETFMTSIGNTVGTVLGALHLDTLFLITSLTDTFVSDFHTTLLPVYKAFSELSAELDRDASFVSVFAETNRAVLYATKAFLPDGALKAELAYATGMSSWLADLKGNLSRYIEKPESIFLDMSLAINKNSGKEASEESAKIWAGIDYASKWIIDKGEVVIALVNQLDTAVKGFPQEIQDSIDKWWKPLRADFTAFTTGPWARFTTDYNTFSSRVNFYLSQHGIDIAALQAKINSPQTLFALMFGQPSLVPSTAPKTFNDFVEQYRAERFTVITDSMLSPAATALATPVPELIAEFPEPSYPPPVAVVIPITPKPSTHAEAWFVGEKEGGDFAPGAQRRDAASWYVGEGGSP